MQDMAPELAQGGGCGNMQFIEALPRQEVLRKYNITKDEYLLICDAIKTQISFGKCNYCG